MVGLDEERQPQRGSKVVTTDGVGVRHKVDRGELLALGSSFQQSLRHTSCLGLRWHPP